MNKITTRDFLDMCEEYYLLVNDCGCTYDEAWRCVSDFMKQSGIYGFRDRATAYGLHTLDDVYRYGGKLAGDFEAYGI